MKILKIKEWIQLKTQGHFSVVATSNGEIHTVKRNRDKVVFCLGSTTSVGIGFIGKNHSIVSFSEDLIHVTLTYQLHDGRTIYWPDIDIDFLPLSSNVFEK